MINGYCRTNLDDYKTQEWPRKFACRPKKDDAVRSKSGQILYICGITHSVDETSGEPQIIVELNKASWSSSVT